MARSYRTDPTKVIAKRRMPSSFAQCRVIETLPKPGDIHPLSGRQISRMIQWIRKRYLYGLESIELRARQGTQIGHPFGLYLNDESRIWIYSVPFPEWRFPKAVPVGIYESHGATIRSDGEEIVVTWPRLVDVAYFIYREVLLHELGHHYHNRYRTKHPHPKTPAAKESSAERLAGVISDFPAFQKWFEE